MTRHAAMLCNPRKVSRGAAAWLLAAVAGLVLLPGAAGAQPVKNVLFLTADSPTLPSNRVILDAVQSALRSEFPATVEFTVETIDARQFANDAYERRLADLFTEKYQGVQIDLVVAITHPAVDFVLREHQRLFSGAPLLLGYIERRLLGDFSLPENSGVVFLHLDVRSTLRFAMRTYPPARRVLVVGGTSRFDRGWQRVVREDLEGFDAAVSVEYDTNSALDDLLRRVAALPADTAVLFTSTTRDGANAPVRSVDVLHRLRAVARVPIYGLATVHLGEGIVGGTLLDFDRHGRELGERAVQLLRGQTSAPSTTPSLSAADWREMQRFGINTATLPPSTVIAFRQQSFWERHWTVIVSLGLVVVIQAALIVTLVTLGRRRREAQRRLEERLRFERRLSELSLALTAAQPEALDEAVEAGLGRVAETLGADWLWRWEPGSPADDGWELPAHGIGVPVTWTSSEPLPPTVRDRLRASGHVIGAAIAVPLSSGGVRPGALLWLSRTSGGDRRARADELMMVATVVGNVLQQQRVARTLRDLTRRLILAREEERRYIARELHDHLNQQLALLAIDLQQLTIRPPDSGDTLVEALQGAWRRTADIASDVHGISHRLHPSKLEALGLVATIRAHCRDVSRQSLVVHFSEQGITGSIPADISLCLFRVVEEALSNAVRHSEAAEADVTLLEEPPDIVLRVSDAGRGFASNGRAGHGIGLMSMRERLHALGGTLTIQSSPGGGTVVEARIPRTQVAEASLNVSASV